MGEMGGRVKGSERSCAGGASTLRKRLGEGYQVGGDQACCCWAHAVKGCCCCCCCCWLLKETELFRETSKEPDRWCWSAAPAAATSLAVKTPKEEESVNKVASEGENE